MFFCPPCPEAAGGRSPGWGAPPPCPSSSHPRAESWLEDDGGPGPALHWGLSQMCSSGGAGVQQAALPAPQQQGCTVCYNPTLPSSPPPDIDECAQGLHNCSQLCLNTPGTHTCLCHPGFRPLDPAASRCLGEYLQCPATCRCGVLPGCPGSRDAQGCPVVLTALVLGGRMDRLWLCRRWWSKETSATQQPWDQAVAGSPAFVPWSCPPHALSIPCPAHARQSQL